MVEAGANQLPEGDVIEAIDFGYEAICELIKAQQNLLKDLGIDQVKVEAPDEDKTLPTFLSKQCTKGISEVLKKFDQSKDERDKALDDVKSAAAEAISALKEDDAVRKAVASNSKLMGNSFKALTKSLMRQQILKDGKRVDGRGLDEVRQISAMAGVLPRRVHGSGLFQRGLTQVLSTATLGTPSDAQERMTSIPTPKRFICTTTTSPLLRRRNTPDAFTRTPRDWAWSSGRARDSSRAARERHLPLCGACGERSAQFQWLNLHGVGLWQHLSLMDAGVPLKAPVSGAAMGLIKEGKEVRILTDIQGIEDFLGDMDFKVAGTEKGITALQMDMKITGLPVSTVARAVNQARPARLHILEKMLEAIAAPRDVLSPMRRVC